MVSTNFRKIIFSQMKIRIPVYKPYLHGNEQQYVQECIASSWISSKGDYIKRFEEDFSDYIGCRHSTGVCNGTIALHLALLALGIGPGDEVIVPTLTYISPVNAITYSGGTPVFVDSDLDTWQMDVEDVRRKITNKTKAIIAVHLYGHPCEMTKIMQLAKEHDLYVVEDAAEAVGSRYQDKMAGAIGHISIFSFYGNKTITTGEGGMVCTNDETLFDRVLHFKGQGLAKYREYWHDVVGYNYRMTNICGAIGAAQLECIEEILEKKQQIASFYKHQLPNGIRFHNQKEGVFHSYWMCTILADSREDREELRTFLAERGIETRPMFYPVHTMPMYSAKYQKLTNAEYLGWRGINLPSFPDLSQEELEEIVGTIEEWCNEKGGPYAS